jgi:metal-responsive CopG/Arc/MetJ family transcriptional regulator
MSHPTMNTEVRTTLNLPASLAKLVDDYWHTKRLNSRNEAIRELLAYAVDKLLPKEPRR